MPEQFIAYITERNVLAKGIQKRLIETTYADNTVRDVNKTSKTYSGEGREWHRTYESACKRAEVFRLRRIEAIEEELERLRVLRFEPQQRVVRVGRDCA